jgi:hypothetical protein
MHVTSDLVLLIESVHHRQGGGGATNYRDKGPKSFVVKILTSKLFNIKILRAIFADPAPIKAFKEVEEGGTHP